MKQSFTKRCGLALVLMLFAFVQGSWADNPVKTTLTFSPTSKNVTLGEGSFQIPTLIIEDASNNRVRKFFRVSYSINGGSYLKASDGKDSTDAGGNKYYQDATTGTTVNEFTGSVKIGNKAKGTVTVKAKATPVAAYADKYEGCEGSYTINVQAPTAFTLHVPYKDSDMADKDTLYLLTRKNPNTWGDPIQSNTIELNQPLKVTYALGSLNVDCTKEFTISYTRTDGVKVEEVKDQKGNITSYKISSTKNVSAKDLNVTFTAVPKDDAAKAKYGDDAKAVFVVNVKSTFYASGKKVKTYLVYENQVDNKYRWHSGESSSKGEPQNGAYTQYTPKVIDEFGNDVTQYYDIHYVEGIPQDVFEKFSVDPFDSGGYAHDGFVKSMRTETTYPNYRQHNTSTIHIYHYSSSNCQLQGIPDDYLFTGLAVARPWGDMAGLLADTADIKGPKGTTTDIPGQFYYANKKNVYHLYPGQYILRVYKRTPTLEFTPDPKDVQIGEGYVMTALNRFDIKCTFKDQYYFNNPDSIIYGGNGTNGFQYTFFIPDSLAYDASKTLSEGEVSIEVRGNTTGEAANRWHEGSTLVQIFEKDGSPKKDADGNPVYELRHGKFYVTMKNWGNENFKIIFHGTGKVPLYYNVFPWNHTKWDITGAQAAIFTSAKQEPVHLKADPSSYTIHVTEKSPKPKAWVEDQFGKDISKYFDITWDTSDFGTDKAATFNADSTSTGNKAGQSTIKFSATKKANDDAVWNSQEDGNTMLYSIYNDPAEKPTHTVYVKSLVQLYEVIYDDDYYYKKDGVIQEDKSEDGVQKIPNRKNAWTSKMGKLHFISKDASTVNENTRDNFSTGEFEYGDTPGLNVIFGEGSDDVKWSVYKSPLVSDPYDGKFDTNGTIVLKAFTPALFGTSLTDDNLLPMPNAQAKTLVSGGCIQLMPTTNGYLQIDGNYGTEKNPRTYYLVDVTKPNEYGDLYIDQVTYKKDLGTAPASAEYSSTSGDIDVPQLKKTANGIEYGDQRFRYALLEGHKYYLFCNSDTFVIHGFTFMPAYVVMREDANSSHKATIFADNGFTGDLPMLVNEKQDDVTFTRMWGNDEWSAQYTSTGTDGKTSTYTATKAIEIKNGYQFVGKDYTRGTRVRVRSSVKGINRSNETVSLGGVSTKLGQVERAPYIDVAVVGIPIYKVGADFTGADPGERVSTTNFVTRIWMTWGGWKSANQETYPYRKDMKLTGNELADAWQVPEPIDSVGMNNKTIDGFKLCSSAAQNPVDENGNSWKKSFNTDSTAMNTFNLPVRGGYVKFEPEESGTLMVYVLQSGLTDLVQYDDRKMGSKPNELRRRAMYIVDEKGKPVDIKDNSTTWTNTDISGAFSENENTQSEHADYMTEGVLRCLYNRMGSFDWKQWYSNYPKGENDKKFEADKNKIESYWNTAKIGDVQQVIRLQDSSFVVPTKAFVRYTFQVKSGKTYYVWCYGSKLRLCGFAFVPDRFMQRNNDEDWPAIKETDTEATIATAREKLPEPSANIYQNSGTGTGAGFEDQTLYEGGNGKGDNENHNTISSSSASYNKAVGDASVNFVNVTLNRPFKNNEWTSICLPFSVNETQVKKIFGDKAMLITFDSVMTKHKVVTDFYQTDTAQVEARTAHFTYHVNQLIEAGRPYFIKPAFNDNTDHNSIEFKHVSLEAVKPMNLICLNDSAIKDSLYADTKLKADGLTDAEKTAWEKMRKEKAIFTYGFAGIYDRTQIPWYSYIMTTQGDENGLHRITPSNGNPNSTKPNLKGFRAYLYPAKDYDGQSLDETKTKAKADLSAFWIRGAEVYDNGGNTPTDIEQLVEEMNTMLTTGHKGVYNLNGMLVRMNNDLSGLPAGVYIMNGKKYLIK